MTAGAATSMRRSLDAGEVGRTPATFQRPAKIDSLLCCETTGGALTPLRNPIEAGQVARTSTRF
jgi:hypothetical protein